MDARDCSLIIPASGFSKRFGTADKLLAACAGAPLATYAAQAAADIGFAQMIAVVPNRQGARAEIFQALGFQIVENASPELGQHASIACGMRYVAPTSKAVCILLADMPLVSIEHLQKLLELVPDKGVINTIYEGHTQPPVIFTGHAMALLQDGKRPDLQEHPDLTVMSHPLNPPFGMDVDTADDLSRAAEFLRQKHGDF